MALQKWLESLDISDCEQVIQQLGLLGITKLEHLTDFDTVEDLKTLSLKKCEKRRFLRGLNSFCNTPTEDFISSNSDHISDIGIKHDGETTTENSLDIFLQGPHSEEYQVTNHEPSLNPESTVGNQDSNIQDNTKEQSFFHRAMNFGGFSGYFPTVGRNPTESLKNTGLSELSETGDTSTSEKWGSNLKYTALPVAGALVGGIVAGPIGLIAGLKFGGFATAAGIGSVAGFASGAMIKENIDDADENKNPAIEKDLIDLNDDITSDASMQDNPTENHQTSFKTDTGAAMPDENQHNDDKDSENEYDEVPSESSGDIKTESLEIQTEFQNCIVTDLSNEMTIKEGYTSSENKDDIADNSIKHSSNEYDELFLDAGLIQLEQIDDLQAEAKGDQENSQSSSSFQDVGKKMKASAIPAAGALLGGIVGGPFGAAAGLKLGALATVTALGTAAGFTGGTLLKDHVEVQRKQGSNEPPTDHEEQSGYPSIECPD